MPGGIQVNKIENYLSEEKQNNFAGVLPGEVLKGEMLKGEGLKAEPRRMLTRPGRLRARSGSKLPKGTVPLWALEDGLQERMYFLLGCVRHSSGKYDLID